MKGKLKLIPFKKEHAQFLSKNLMNDPRVQFDKNFENSFIYLEEENLSFSAIYKDTIIVSGGITPLWEGVYEGWVMASSEIWNFKLEAAYIIKKKTDELCKTNNVIRLQTAVKKDFKLGHRFASWLGLEEEGIMKKYILNQDHIRYARVK